LFLLAFILYGCGSGSGENSSDDSGQTTNSSGSSSSGGPPVSEDTTYTAPTATIQSLELASIQAECDRLEGEGGGTLVLPEGTVTHSDRLRIPDGITIMGQGKGRTIINNAYFFISTRFYGNLNRSFRIAGMTLAQDSVIELDSVTNFRIDHMRIEKIGGIAIRITNSTSGLIDHSEIDATNYGVAISFGSGAQYSIDWVTDTSSLLGGSEAIFLENNDFWNYHHAIVGHSNAHYVARYNNFNGGETLSGHAIDAHGPGYTDTGTDPENTGTRLVEAYNNKLIGNLDNTDVLWKAVAIRGGSAVIFDNEFINYRNGIVLTLEGDADDYNPGNFPHDIWVWNNTHREDDPELWENGMVFITDGMNGGYQDTLSSFSEIIEDQDYFLREPNMILDGFIYTPYVYPHPFQEALP
jgi:hypothetical protein